jgi:hypothetical protein
MHETYKKLAVVLVLLFAAPAFAEPTPDELQASFNRKYRQYLGADSQMLLPFTLIEAQEWKRVQESRPLLKLYSEPGKYYNQKVYTFTLYRAGDSGEYYLNAKGGFWGMDELSYGPLTEKVFE